MHDCAEDEATLQMSNGALGVAQGPVAALGVARYISVPRCAQWCAEVRQFVIRPEMYENFNALQPHAAQMLRRMQRLDSSGASKNP